MEVVRDREIGKVKVTLHAVDQYNDYSVIYDHFIAVNYGNGRGAQFPVGTNRAAAIKKFDEAVALVWKHKAMEAA